MFLELMVNTFSQWILFVAVLEYSIYVHSGASLLDTVAKTNTANWPPQTNLSIGPNFCQITCCL